MCALGFCITVLVVLVTVVESGRFFLNGSDIYQAPFNLIPSTSSVRRWSLPFFRTSFPSLPLTSLQGCTAFDLSPLEGDNRKKGKEGCLLYGHTDVRPASALKGRCYLMGLEGEEVVDEDEQVLEVTIQGGEVELKRVGEGGACR